MLTQVNEDQYLDIARKTEVFKPEELSILKEMLADYYSKPNGDYIFLEERLGENIIGFVVFGKTSLTSFAWDIYWLIVDKDSQNQGVGKRLLNRLEKYVLDIDPKAILRVETSSKIQYNLARDFYKKRDFLLVGRVPDFYESGDDLLILSKQIQKEDKIIC